MFKINFLLISFILLLFISCHNRAKNERIVYYDNGIIKEKIVFVSKDTSSYNYSSYYNDGTLKEEYTIKNNELNGRKVEYNINGNIKSIVNYLNGKVEGIVQVFNDLGEIELYKTYNQDKLWGQYFRTNKNQNVQQEILFINDNPVIRIDKGLVKVENDSIFGITYFYRLDSVFFPIGSLSYYYKNGVKNRKQKSCSYFETFSKDTINYGDSLEIEIVSHLGLIKDHKISLDIGEIDEYYNFKDSSEVVSYVSKSNVLKIVLTKEEYKTGINLLTGKIRVYNKNGDEITQKYMMNVVKNTPYLFFKQFCVITS